jgi:hypothetical protein
MPETSEPSAGLERDNPTQVVDAEEKEAGFLDGLANSPSNPEAALQPTGKDATQAQGDGAQATPQLPGFASALPKESRSDEKILQFVSKFKSWDELTKAAIEAESKLGKMVELPEDDASPKAAEFYKKLGVPEKPEDYKLEVDKRVNIDPKQLEATKQLAFDLKLTQKQAAELWKRANENAVQLLTQSAKNAEKSRAERYASTINALKTEWGKDFARNDEIVKRAVDAFGSEGFMKAAKENDFWANPEFIKFMHRVGLSITEDTIGGGGPIGQSRPVSGIDRPGL